MGTNYYLHKNTCPHCGHCEERIHIGKASFGWQFLFSNYCESFQDWKKLLDQYPDELFDEYKRKEDLTEFYEMIERKQKELNHWYDFEDPDKYEYYDNDGYRISKSYQEEGF